MKRPHRRFHFMMWLVLAPVTAITAIYFWMQRPQTPITDLPDAIETLNEEGV